MKNRKIFLILAAAGLFVALATFPVFATEQAAHDGKNQEPYSDTWLKAIPSISI